MIEIYYSGEEVLSEEEMGGVELAIKLLCQIEEIDGPGELSVSFVDQEEIAALNRDYRGIDKVTDVLSFPQFESKNELVEAPYSVLGDIVVNMDRVRSQAKEYGHSLMRELIYLTIHSFYHLLGYDHEDDEDKKLMRTKEEIAYGLVEEKL